jgi:hypothetical protein
VIFGAVVKYKKKLPGGKPYWNAAVLAQKGKIIGVVPKQLLPSYDIFDDTRFFESGEKTKVWKLKGLGKVVISVCEDMWSPETGFYKTIPISKIGKPDLIVNISASPFSMLKNKRRLNCAKGHVKRIKAPFIYVNQVGAQDEIIFQEFKKSFNLSFYINRLKKAKVFAVTIKDALYPETLKKIVESYIGTEKLQNKVSLDQAVEKFKTDFSQLSIAPKFEIKEMKSSTDDLNLGIFLKGVSAMPTLRIVLGRKETDNGQVLVNILSWGFNDYLYSVRDHKNAKLYLYLNTRKDLNRFLLQFAEALPQIWTAPK